MRLAFSRFLLTALMTNWPSVGGAAPPLDDKETWEAGKGCRSGCGSDHLICKGDLFSHNSAVPGCCNPEAAGGASFCCKAKPTSGLGLYCVPGDLCTSSGHSCRPDLFAADFGLSGCCVDGDAPTEACKDHEWFSS